MTQYYRNVSELDQAELDEYTSVSWQVAIYVLIGTGVALIFDKLGLMGYLPEGIVRAIAGTADTLGLTITALIVFFVSIFRSKSIWGKQHLPNFGKPKAVTWIIGGLFGLFLAFFLEALVYLIADDPHGPAGVVYAFGFSNLDNTMAGATVLIAVLINHGIEGWNRYWRHPYFFGNAFMLIVIPLVALAVRVFTHFRPVFNVPAGIESGLMDVDSVGAAVIFLLATRIFKVRVPYMNDSLADAVRKIRRRIDAGS